jgi:hypothetical protein
MGRALADANQVGDLRDPDVGIVGDTDEHVAVVRQKRPRGRTTGGGVFG